MKSFNNTVKRAGRFLPRVVRICWAIFFFTLPITSFPFMPDIIGGDALVRPLSIYPLIILLILSILPTLFQRALPRTLLILTPFLVIGLISCLLALPRGIDPVHGVTVGDRMLRALLTLGLGGSFYLAVVLLNHTRDDLRFSLRWMYAGFSLAMFLGSLQSLYIIRFSPAWFKFMSHLQEFISTRRLINNRISGATYEPNWFAEQITFLLMPWLIASVLNGYTIFRWRWRWVTVEILLLAWGTLLIPFTFSRAGVINIVVVALTSLLFFRFQLGQRRGQKTKFIQRLPRILAEAGLAILVIGSLLYIIGTRNPFFARIWGYWLERKHISLSGYLTYLGFDARLVYGETAYRTYQEYTAFGVGLGNYALYFNEMLEDKPLAYTPEVLRLLTQEEGRSRLITPKILYLRLLAETGLLGTVAFMVFIIALFGCALYLWTSPQKEDHYWGSAGLLGMIVFIFAALSFDSFALPNMWVIFGLVTAAAWISSKEPAVPSPVLTNDLLPSQDSSPPDP